MDDIIEVENCFKHYWPNLLTSLPEGILKVDLKLLMELNLLNFSKKEISHKIFHVVESEDKITLVNNNFVVWIVPEIVEI